MKTASTETATEANSADVTEATPTAETVDPKTPDVETPLPATPDVGADHAPESAAETSLADGPAQMGDDTAPIADDEPDGVADAKTEPADAMPLAAGSAGDSDGTMTDTASDAEPVLPSDSDRPQAQTPPVAPAVASGTPEKRGGFFPMLLGGVAAAGIGYGAHYYQTSTGTGPDSEVAALQAELAQVRAIAEQGPDLSALEDQIAALTPAAPAEPVDISPLQADINALSAQIDALPDAAALQAEIAALRSASQVDLTPVEDALAALEAAYSPLPEQIAALEQDMEELRALATTEVADAEAAVDAAMARAGLDRIRAALVTGAPFEDAVSQIAQSGAEVPDALSGAAAGVQTVEMLQDGYGAAARAAIAASLQAAPAESATEKLGNFFRAQVGARSLAPREGDDPDAVTSRAGAAVAEGDLPAALDELAALPQAGRDAMSGWLNAVETRLNAAGALDALQATITTE